ncbi:MAG: UDP-N-acetylmuramoyl-L-alanine--D-glutamate ligase [Cetobacterium sp.]|uniref:UDP-N-acetylmuramoyl-L-alanine--D-glutamate ligase n=1 Tax=Cetobacterium sp. TaxID=2071632 RepID=UPI003F2F1FCD
MKKAMVFGAGVSGNGAKNLLEKENYEVILVDDKRGITSQEGIELLKEIDLFIKSPGTPYNQLVKEAKNMNIEVIDEIELAYRYMKKVSPETKIIAITGTNGKTTTTTKIKELLDYAGIKGDYAGNIGYSYGQLLLDRQDLDYIVLELSSYQLENIKEFKANIAMVINLAPDHMDRYEKVDDYYDAKWNICKNQTKNDFFILNSNCENCLKREERILGKEIIVGLEKNRDNQDIYVQHKEIIYKGKALLNVDKLALKGKHNLENSLFILAVGEILGIELEKIQEFLYNTKSLEHRMEDFYEWGKVKFINDSKGTNIESTKFAVEAYENPILICGGVDKKLDLTPLIQLIKDRVKEVYLIGQIGENIQTLLKDRGYNQNRIFNCHTLENVMEVLKGRLKKENTDIVLLSPTTASFDQFKNYEERGRIFKELVKKNFD